MTKSQDVVTRFVVEAQNAEGAFQKAEQIPVTDWDEAAWAEWMADRLEE
jgi:hypothetical protein